MMTKRQMTTVSRQRVKKGRTISGWIILDKPLNMGSTDCVSKIKWLYKAQKCGHAGTLDPLATGMLPIALGEATKTVPYVMDGQKTYRFAVTWGAETNTDDLEGEFTQTQRQTAQRRGNSRRSCQITSARSNRFRRNIPPSRSMANAPTSSPATARK